MTRMDAFLSACAVQRGCDTRASSWCTPWAGRKACVSLFFFVGDYFFFYKKRNFLTLGRPIDRLFHQRTKKKVHKIRRRDFLFWTLLSSQRQCLVWIPLVANNRLFVHKKKNSPARDSTLFFPSLCCRMVTSGNDLPDEILFHIASFGTGRDLWAMGMGCRRLRHVARDQRLWRRLFVRDFGSRYDRGLTERPQPTCHFDVETWPPEARLLYERAGAAASMPPPYEPTVGVPLPLARAFAVGKDWTWLYLVHARKGSTGPGTLRVRNTVHVGDWTDGVQFGYGASVEFAPDGVTVASWTEYFEGGAEAIPGWRVVHASSFVCYMTLRFSFSEWRPDGGRAWHARGPRVVDGMPEWSGATDVRISTYSGDGSYNVKSLRGGNEHGVVRTVFPNGDVQAVRYANGERVGNGEFVCSPRCPDARYAGRTLSFECTFYPPCHAPKRYIVPVDSKSEDARLFWQYVNDRLIGWEKSVIERCIREIPLLITE